MANAAQGAEHGACHSEAALANATAHDQAHVQRSPAASLLSLRRLGSGTFATVDLVSVPVGQSRKLAVRKTLAQDALDDEGAAAAAAAAADGGLPPAGPGMKPSTQADWTREAAMHRECEGCPFVVQMLAAKRSRSGDLLLLLEYAAHGSMTDVLAARQAQLDATLERGQQQARPQEPGQQPQEGRERRRQQQEQQEQQEQGPVLVSVVDDSTQAQQQQQQAGALLAPAVVASVSLPAAASGQPVHVAAGDCCAAAAGGPAAVALALAPPPRAGLPEEAARFYAACILMALRTLHGRRILHRDLKPCNLLLFADGYLKLADLGCCVQLPAGVAGAQTRTGTAAYMAPEVAGGGGATYSYPVDLWSLGVTIWQMVDGRLPRWAEEQEGEWARQQQLLLLAQGAGAEQQGPPPPPLPRQHTTPDQVVFPGHFSKELCLLLDGLLHEDGGSRLSIEEVQRAPWFRGFDWAALAAKELTPPAVSPLGPPAALRPPPWV